MWQGDLHNFPLAAPQIPTESQQWLDERRLVRVERSLASDSYILLKRVARGTDHIVGGPQFLFAAEVAANELVELPIPDPPLWHVSVLVSRPASHSKIVRAFVECIKAEMAAIVS